MTIIDAVRDPNIFGPWFTSSTWDAWITFLKVLFQLPMDIDDAVTYRRHTGRTEAPGSPFREAWVIVGRRGGKSLVSALCAVFVAAFRDHSRHLKPGEIGTVSVIAADRRQARTIMRYVRAFLDVPMLRQLVTGDTAESIELSNRVVIEVHSASFRSVRGYTLLAVICDEVAFWRSDESANPDREIIAAVRPGLATIPGSMLLCISSPYARRGALWDAHRRYHGQDSPVLVWQAPSRAMNPSLPQSVIDQALEEDESSARAEYLAEFRRDIETFIPREAVEACVVPGRYEAPPSRKLSYVAFVDPSGGSSDSMTLAISHHDPETKKAVLDLVREVRPPFNPDSVTEEFTGDLKRYGISKVTGDNYGAEWPKERFRAHGIRYEVAEHNRSELYLETLPRINAREVELLDNPRLISQLVGLERRTSRSGRDSVDHPPGGHDDLANAVAGALVAVSSRRRERIYVY